MRSRLYSFFITDDAARTMAFVCCVLSATLVSTVLLLVGLSPKLCAAVSGLVSPVVLAFMVYRYVMHPKPLGKYSRAYTSRRSLLGSFGASVVEVSIAELLTSIFGRVGAAIAFAQTTYSAVKSNQDVSGLKLTVAKQTIATALRRENSLSQEKQLINAYSKLEAAEIYNQAREGKNVFLRSQASDLRIPQHAVVIRGNGGYAYMKMPTSGTHIHLEKLGHQFMIFEDFVFEGPEPPLRAELISITKPSKILFKNCVVKNYHQLLDGISWFDVTFEGCELESSLQATLLIDVTFKNCSVQVPVSNAFPIQSSEHVDISGVTYSSEAQSLAS
jgi:hypothetical protein